MRSEVELRRQKWEWLRPLFLKVLPQAVATSRVDVLEEYSGPFVQFIRQWAAIVAQAYRKQIAAFNRYSYAAEIGLVVFVFARASWPAPFGTRHMIALLSILCALALRDVYAHRNRRLTPILRYYLDSAGDAAVAGVFLFFSESFILHVSPSDALPASVLYHGALICLPLISVLRIVLRPKPEPNSPFKLSEHSAKQLFRMTWRLNVLWMVAFQGLLLQNVCDCPSKLDELRGSIPALTIMLWIAVQRNCLDRRDKIVTLFTDVVKQTARRHKATLPAGLKKGEPFYWWYRILEVVIFLELTAGLLEVIWPWLSGEATGFVRPALVLVAFVTIVLSWQYVKAANRATAAVLQAVIEAEGDILPLSLPTT